MRQQTLSTIKTGMTRLRSKGGASPDALYDLLNGYVTVAQTVKSRPGTRIAHIIPDGCRGLVWFKNRFVTFSHTPLASPDPRVRVEVLPHPEDDDTHKTPLHAIHYALPFLGHLYVVAEFVDGLTRHYWLETGPRWQPNSMYQAGDVARPATGDNGLVYVVANTHDGLALWTPNVSYQVGDVVLPTVYNGYRYVVTEVHGERARSGEVEPIWPAVPDATVDEDADDSPRTDTPTPPPGTGHPPGGAPPRNPDPRYGSGQSRAGNNTALE